MITKYYIHINYGDNEITKRFVFIHKEYQTLSKEAQDAAFDEAVKELNHIYKDYGRFATQVGILRLFDRFGFEQDMD